MSKEHLVQIFQDGQLITQREIPDGRILTLGREPSDLVINGAMLIVGKYATLSSSGGHVWLEIHSKNVSFRGQERLMQGQPYALRDKDEIKLAGGKHLLKIIEKTPVVVRPTDTVIDLRPPSGEARAIKVKRNRIRLTFTNRQGEGISNPSRFTDILNQRGRVTIGRDSSNDIVLSSLLVSRKHAMIDKQQSGTYLHVLSPTGVFVNGRKVDRTTLISENDTFTVGQFRFSLSGKVEDVLDSNEPAIVASNVQKIYKNGFIGLQSLSLQIPSRGFVALMGPSGCGKSTLLKCLNGDSPASNGKVSIHGLELNTDNFNLLKRSIGYVPQDDIVHRELTVNETMRYAARLRLADDVSEEEAKERIDKVLSDLNINDAKIRSNKIGELSGGQRKRISIAVELLNDPSILFLDEPTSPLDPETIDDFLNCIKKLTDEGTTVVMVTHKPTDLDYVDQVIFLSKGGYITYFGKIENIYTYFNIKNNNIILIYSMLSDLKAGQHWYGKWTKAGNNAPKPAVTNQEIRKPRSESLLRQYYWLSRRYFNIKWNDQGNVLLLASQPVIISLLICFIFENLEIGVLFLMALSAVWFGVSNAAKEIVGELPIYKRERMYNLGIVAYIASKVTILSVIALMQVAIFVLIVYLRYNSGDVAHGVKLYYYWANVGFLFYLSVSASILGLLISSLVTNTERLMTLVPISIIPQVMLAGIVARLDSIPKELISYGTLGRWGTEGLARIQNTGAKSAHPQDSILAGIVTKIPVMDKDSMATVPRDALKILNLYPKEALAWFNGYNANLIAIMLLNAAVLACLYWQIRKKDSI